MATHDQGIIAVAYGPCIFAFPHGLKMPVSLLPGEQKNLKPGRSILSIAPGNRVNRGFWQEDVPVVIKVNAKLIPEWKMHPKYASADDPLVSPVVSKEKMVMVDLVPYGCTRLRITEFPVIE